MRRDVLRKRILESKASSVDARDLDYKLKQLRRAAVDAEKLTQSEEWDAYLQQIAALNEADQQALMGHRTASETGIYMDADQCQRIEFERALLRAKIQARNECIEIPKTIIQGSTSTGN
jgi:hypothetical protein